MVGKPWLGRQWRRAADIVVARARDRDGGRREVPVCRRCSSPRPPVPRSVPRCSSCSARRTAGPRRRRSPPRWPTAASTCRASRSQRAEGGRSQLYVADAADGAARLRQGVRTRQPRRRSPVPRLPHAPAARTERQLAVAVAQARRRARGPPAAARAPGRGRRARASSCSRRSTTDRSCSRSSTSTVAGSTSCAPEAIDDRLLDATWRRGRDAARPAHGAPRAARRERARRRRRAGDHRPRLRRGVGDAADAGDRPRRAARVARRARRRRNGRSRRRRVCSDRPRSRRALPTCSRSRLSAATRKQVSKSLLQRAARRGRDRERRGAGAARAADPRAAPHARHDRRARRRVLRPAARSSPTSATASRRSRHANWAWLVVCVVMSLLTYVGERDRHGGRRGRAPPVRPQPRSAAGVVVREPRLAGQRRRHGAQRALPAEGGGPDRPKR